MLSSSIWKQGPMWARPKMPFEDIASGARQGGGFNPGGQFGSGTNPYGQKQTALPSLQRWGRMAPSEQDMQVGIWKDEMQVDPRDVFSQMNKLRPKTSTSFAPRWMA